MGRCSAEAVGCAANQNTCVPLSRTCQSSNPTFSHADTRDCRFVQCRGSPKPGDHECLVYRRDYLEQKVPFRPTLVIRQCSTERPGSVARMPPIRAETFGAIAPEIMARVRRQPLVRHDLIRVHPCASVVENAYAAPRLTAPTI
jgi:hypothetical protein